VFWGEALRQLLDHRFDAFAAETHENLAPRAAVALGAGGGALMLLPWRLCAIWTVSILAYELWGWFASRQQFLGRPASFGERLGFATFLACLTSCWFLLGMGFWLTGTMAGAVCAAIVWVGVIGFAQTFSSRTPLGLAICGIAPAMGVLTLMLAAATPPGLTRAPVTAIMLLCVGFAIACARQIFAAGRSLGSDRRLDHAGSR
jgi:hypothetical protein